MRRWRVFGVALLFQKMLSIRLCHHLRVPRCCDIWSSKAGPTSTLLSPAHGHESKEMGQNVFGFRWCLWPTGFGSWTGYRGGRSWLPGTSPIRLPFRYHHPDSTPWRWTFPIVVVHIVVRAQDDSKQLHQHIHHLHSQETRTHGTSQKIH